MKLSEEKVTQLSEALLDQLMEIDGVMFQGSDVQILHAMREIMANELMVEELLDAEIHKLLQAYKYEITMGRMSYDELFKKTRQRLIRERRLVL